MPSSRRPAHEIRDAIVSAAVEVTGDAGLGALTHRAVAERAGVSLSSTTYHYASRDAIVVAAVERVAEREQRQTEAMSRELAALGPDQARSAFVEGLAQLMAPKDRSYLRAQYELQLYATDHPEAGAAVRDWIGAIESLAREVLTELGAPDPAEAARVLVAAIDGLRLTALTAAPRKGERPPLDAQLLDWLVDRLLSP